MAVINRETLEIGVSAVAHRQPIDLIVALHIEHKLVVESIKFKDP
jgi:hypothetical protein